LLTKNQAASNIKRSEATPTLNKKDFKLNVLETVNQEDESSIETSIEDSKASKRSFRREYSPIKQAPPPAKSVET